MKILFTGSSSFTGMWFIEELSKLGHSVTATFLKPLKEYTGIKIKRIERIKNFAVNIVDNCPFGSEIFLNTIAKYDSWDLLCHHAADVYNYKSKDFNCIEAIKKNSYNINLVLESLKEKGCNKILLTGSVFEQREGLSSSNLRAVSLYGLSKGITSDIFSYFCDILDINLGKFVIPNPFGPYEEEKFTSYLAKNWIQKKIPLLSYPDYTRDNIHVSLLALCYANFSQKIDSKYKQINPSQYAESQLSFTDRFSKEMKKRLGIDCDYEILKQKDFSEPLVRINKDKLNYEELKWNEKMAWDVLATYYFQTYQ